MKWYKLDKNKNVVECSMEEGSAFCMSAEKLIKQEDTPNGLFVSTVFLGIDHAFSIREKRDVLPPLIFETMVFDHRKGESYFDIDQRRYHTYDEAVKGHIEMVEEWTHNGSINGLRHWTGGAKK